MLTGTVVSKSLAAVIMPIFKKLFRYSDGRGTARSFLPLENPHSLDEDQTAHLVNHLKRTHRTIRMLLTGSNASIMDLLCCANSDYPIVQGRIINTGESVSAGKGSQKKGLYRIDLLCENDVHLKVGIGGLFYEIQRECSVYHIKSGRQGLRRTKAAPLLSVAVYSNENENVSWFHIAAQSKAFFSEKIPANKTGFMEVHVVSGQAWWLQTAEFTGTDARYLQARDTTGAKDALPCSPRMLRLWEERARRAWHLSLLAAIGIEIIDLFPEIVDNSMEIRDDFYDFLALLVQAIHYYPTWRPAAGFEPSSGPWERGNWANGFLLGAYGIALNIAWHRVPPQIQNSGAIVAKQKGIQWLAPPHNGHFTRLHFPSVTHWRKRSTNHGIVILSSAVVGILELQKRFGNGYCRNVAKYVQSCFWELVRSSFEDGIYLEGLKYAQFSLQESIVYFIYAFCESGQRWVDFESSKLAFLRETNTFFWLSAVANSNEPFTNWGDSPASTWKQSVLQFMTALNHPDAHALRAWLLPPIPANRNLCLAKGEIVKSEPIIAAASLLPKLTNCPKIKQDGRAINFKRANMAAVVRTMADGKILKLWALGARLHLTHNLDHDSGSFFLANGPQVLFGEVPGRGAWRHSTVLIPNTSLADPVDEFSFHGGQDESGALIDRNYEGLAEARQSELGFEIDVRVRRAYPSGGERHLLTSFRRRFLSPNDDPEILIVITEAHFDGVSRAAVNFVVPQLTATPLSNCENMFALEGNAVAAFASWNGQGEVHLQSPTVSYPAYRLIHTIPIARREFLLTCVVILMNEAVFLKDELAINFLDRNNIMLKLGAKNLKLHF